jgi:cytidine deaminase
MVTDEIKEQLIHHAVQARKRAYDRYSHYPVGAALLTTSGKIIEGSNIENAVYPLTLCAERVAVFKAVSEGEMHFEAIAVATRNGGTPCGACRQVLREFSKDLLVLIADDQGNLKLETTLAELLPHSFGPDDLAE